MPRARTRFPIAVVAAASVSACSIFQSDTAPVRLGEAARQARQAEGWERRTYVYLAADLTTSGLPNALVTARQANPSIGLLSRCDPATPTGSNPQSLVPPVVIPLIMAIFNIVIGQVERGIAAQEKRRLASLSDQFTSNVALRSFPLSATAAVSCIVIDDVETRSDEAGNLLELRPRSLFTIQLRRIGRAFVIEPTGVRIDSSKIIRANMASALNVDLSLAFTTVPGSNSQTPPIYGYPAYNVRFENVQIGKTHIASASDSRSIVMPVPQDAETPTSLIAAVTESHVTLAREQERIALEQANRKALFEAAAEMLKTKLGE